MEGYGMEFSGRVSMVNRLATFIQAATEELAAANRQLEMAAISDGLTRLYNRMEIQRRITERVNRFSDETEQGISTRPVSLIMMDVDDFKKVNDTYGHAEGDQVLIRLAEMLKRTIDVHAPGSVAGRWGGEEFMVMLPGFDLDMAAGIAEIMRNGFKEIGFDHCGHQTMSLGVAQAISGENPDILCMRVDDALYKAKKQGKNQVVRG